MELIQGPSETLIDRYLCLCLKSTIPLVPVLFWPTLKMIHLMTSECNKCHRRQLLSHCKMNDIWWRQEVKNVTEYNIPDNAQKKKNIWWCWDVTNITENKISVFAREVTFDDVWLLQMPQTTLFQSMQNLKDEGYDVFQNCNCSCCALFLCSLLKLSATTHVMNLIVGATFSNVSLCV